MEDLKLSMKDIKNLKKCLETSINRGAFKEKEVEVIKREKLLEKLQFLIDKAEQMAQNN